MSNTKDIVKPWVYKDKWYVWPMTVFDSMNVLGCYVTLQGACTSGKTVDECIDSCVTGCSAGYHVAFPDGKTMCAPFDGKNDLDASPIQMLRRQDLYPELSNVVVTTFVNTAIHPFPPEQANVVFYEDMLNIKVSGTDLFMSQDGSSAIVDDSGVTIQLTPSRRVISSLAGFNSVKYGDIVTILIANTGLEARPGNTHINWTHAANAPGANPIGFSVEPVDGNKTGVVTYGDKVNLVFQGYSPVAVDRESKNITLHSRDVSELKDGYYTSFEFKSQMLGFYCDGRKCKSVAISDIKTNGPAGSYKGVTVARNPDCWGACAYLKLGTNELEPLATHPSSPSPSPNSHIPSWVLPVAIVGMGLVVIVGVLLLRGSGSSRAPSSPSC